MLNQIILVGRILRKPELKEAKNGKEVSSLTIVVPRNFKNMNGEYESDYIDCTLWDTLAKSTVEYCQEGDIVGIKGRIASRSDNSEQKKLEIVAEKITFLSKDVDRRKDKNDQER